MRILFQGTPAPLRISLVGHEVSTAHEHGWSSLSNGDLLSAAEEGGLRRDDHHGSESWLSTEPHRTTPRDCRAQVHKLAADPTAGTPCHRRRGPTRNWRLHRGLLLARRLTARPLSPRHALTPRPAPPPAAAPRPPAARPLRRVRNPPPPALAANRRSVRQPASDPSSGRTAPYTPRSGP